MKRYAAAHQAMAGAGMFLGVGSFVHIQFNGVLLENKGLDPFQIGTILGLGATPALVLPLLVGMLSQRIGSLRGLLLVVGVGTGVCLALLPQLHGFIPLALGFLIFQSFGVNQVPLTTSILLRCPSTRSHGAFLGIRAMGTLGFAVVSVVFGRWVTVDRLDMAYLILGALVIASLPFWWTLPESDCAPQGSRATVLPFDLLRGATGRLLLVTSLAFLPVQMGQTLLGNYVVSELNGTAADVSRAWSLSTFVEFGVMFAAIPVARRFGLRGLMTAGFAAAALRWAWVAVAPDTTWFLPSQVLHGVIVVGVMTAPGMTLAGLVPKERIPEALALLSILTGGLGGVLGGLLGGALWDLGGLRLVYASASGLSLLALLILRRVVRTPPAP